MKSMELKSKNLLLQLFLLADKKQSMVFHLLNQKDILKKNLKNLTNLF